MRPVRRRTAQASMRSVFVPAPLGGMNTVASAGNLPPGDCVWAYNVIPGEQGLEVRPGWSEWCTGLTGALDNTVRTTIPFVGSRKNGTSNKLYACTSTGIWDVSASSAAPVQVIAFPSSAGDAGFGVWCVASSPAGRFLYYADEENGLYIYPESTATWVKVALGVTELWAGSTAYLVGNQVVNQGNVYICTVAGISAASGGPTTTVAGITDGTVTWDYVSATVAGTIGPSLPDQQAGFTGDPANVAFVMTWKSRVWFVEKDTSRAWYLGVNSVYGTATSVDLGAKMQRGGPLVGLYDWSYDGGSGMDSLLVGISGAGDVVIYQGTDPSSASTFGIKGSWSVAGVPAGRRVATDFGGELLVMSSRGIIPLSKLVTGRSADSLAEYATAKISNLFARLTRAYRSVLGWSMVLHPTANALIVTVPSVSGAATSQLAMSFASGGWFRWRDLPILSAGVWEGELYFGTNDGRICRNTGYVDGTTLADADAGEAVEWSLLEATRNLGNALWKQVQRTRPRLLSETPNATVQATARYNYDQNEPTQPTGDGGGGDGSWDASTWDSSVWGGDTVATQGTRGATGMGREVAVAVQGNAISRTTYVGVDVDFTVGGIL